MSTLSSAIADAAAELQSKAQPTPEAQAEATEEVATEETQEESAEDEPESDDEPKEQDLSDDEILESKNLYKALRGPQAAAIIAALAQQAGILPKANEAPLTKREEASAKRDIKEIFADALGKEYGFLAERLGPAIEAVMQQERDSSESRFAELQQTNVEREVVAAYEKLATVTKGESKKFEARMAQLSEEIPIGNMNVKTYMERLYTLASNERKSSPQKVADQIRRNASDAPARLRSAGSVPLPVGQVPDKKMNLNESIAWAQSQINKRK